MLERAVILAQGPRLPLDLALPQAGDRNPSSRKQLRADLRGGYVLRQGDPPYADLKRIEYENILTAVEQACWKVYGVGGAADLLDINPTTLASRMKVTRDEACTLRAGLQIGEYLSLGGAPSISSGQLVTKLSLERQGLLAASQ